MSQHLYGQLIHHKEGKNIQWIKASSTNDIVKTGKLHAKESDLISHLYTEISSKWMKCKT